MDSLPTDDLKKPPAYRSARAHIFPSDGSLGWYLRTRRDELVKAGALKKIGGQWFIRESRFDAVLLGEPVAEAKGQG